VCYRVNETDARTSATTHDVVLAYRLAKTDLYFTQNARALDLLAYEADLGERLRSLRTRINGKCSDWVDDPEFVGDSYLAPKGLKDSNNSTTDETIELRLMARCSIDLHVFSTYWMMTVGEKIDAALSSSVLGYRLRRTTRERFNLLGSGSFPSYMPRYRKWRDGPLEASRKALEDGREVAVLTGDATRFFHSLDPRFLANADFLLRSGVELNAHETRVNRLFVRALDSWRECVSRKRPWNAQGLPVGLPASAVVANAALIELDRLIETEIKPIKYARYVDDISIVLENDASFTQASDVWRWIAQRSAGAIQVLARDEDSAEPRVEPISQVLTGDVAVFSPAYLGGASVKFGNRKNSLLKLAGTKGADQLNALAERIRESSSEWRLMSTVPDKPEAVGAEVARAVQPSGDHGGTLRDADVVTLTRSRFAICVSDYEAYAQDLPSASWAPQRQRFLRAVKDQVLESDAFFELGSTFSRVVALATACGDYEEVADLINGVATFVAHATATHPVSIAGGVDPGAGQATIESVSVWNAWRRDLAEEAFTSVVVSLPVTRQEAWDMGTIADALSSLDPTRDWFRPDDELTETVRAINARDLGYVALRRQFLHGENVRLGATGPLPRLGKGAKYPTALVESVQAISDILAIPAGVQAGVMFATRPVRLDELYLAQADGDSRPASDSLTRAMIGARGYDPRDSLATAVDEPTTRSRTRNLTHSVLRVKGGRKLSSARKVHVALGVTQSEGDTWKGAALGVPELTLAKRNRLARLVNDAIGTRDPIDYFVLHELAIPSAWFMRIALKLRAHNIGLISGVEYVRRDPNLVANQVWAALPIHHAEVPSMYIHKQDKQLPAPHEEEALTELGNLRLEPSASRNGPEDIPVIDHGGFYFSLLICHELTDISARAYLRGKVDALFVPEHNQDTKSFSSLVESSALDIHAYIVQANDRRFGDSRVRAPRKKDYQRDLVRVSRGTRDYVVAAKLDIDSLRVHQTMYRPDPNVTGFKPCPSGFEITPARAKIPPVSRRQTGDSGGLPQED